MHTPKPMVSMARAARWFAAAVCSVAPLHADDWYVDAIHGDDANGGSSVVDAWRTITHALAAVPPVVDPGQQLIHVARGVYDAALGESFPLDIERGFVLSGPSDRSAVIDGGGAAVVLVRFGHASDPGYVFDQAGLERFRLRAAESGFEASGANPSRTIFARDLEVTGMASFGLTIGSGPAELDVRLERVDAHGNGRPLVAATAGHNCSLLAEDCEFSSNGAGVSLGGCCSSGLSVAFHRCRIAHNGGTAMSATASLFGGVYAVVEDSALVDNAGDAWYGSGSFDGAAVGAIFARCTIAGNAGTGIVGLLSTHVDLEGCVLWGNGGDINHISVGIYYCDVESGDGAGVDGNISADPLFVDPAQGDYRLGWASPCIEAGDPATTPDTRDLGGVARPIDGDLDTLEAFDMGAWEFAPLSMASTGELGTTLVFEIWGPQDAPATLFFSRKSLAAPRATPFGELELERPFMGVFRVATAGSGPPTIVSRALPLDPTLIGRTFAFQALTASPAAPAAFAYTNAVELTLVP